MIIIMIIITIIIIINYNNYYYYYYYTNNNNNTNWISFMQVNKHYMYILLTILKDLNYSKTFS